MLPAHHLWEEKRRSCTWGKVKLEKTCLMQHLKAIALPLTHRMKHKLRPTELFIIKVSAFIITKCVFQTCHCCLDLLCQTASGSFLQWQDCDIWALIPIQSYKINISHQQLWNVRLISFTFYCCELTIQNQPQNILSICFLFRTSLYKITNLTRGNVQITYSLFLLFTVVLC